ncbi:Transient-receptor-potential-like protein [Aphelenchoides besseyi]|nr:Transient-receptor-potential-like protein [Aphelenchoides besseyi]
MAAGRGFFIRRVLTPLKLPNLVLTEERVDGCEGVYEWQLTDELIRAMRCFQKAVNEKREDAVESIIESLFDNGVYTEVHARNLAVELCRHDCEALKEVLLTAILTASRPLVEFILQLFHRYPNAEFEGCQQSLAFPPHITPLLLACLCNNFAIVECLLLRGHQLNLPHRHDCYCRTCKELTAYGRNETHRMDAYRAACSEAFLWLSTDDPLLAAMHMLKDLEDSQQFNNEHRELYANLYDQVQQFANSLIQQCWNFEEVDFLMKQKNGAELSNVNLPYPRIRMALDYRMKQFVSHINIQSVMKGYWLGNWTNFGRSYTRDCYRYVRHVILFPILAFLHAISAGHWIKTFNYPRARFMSNTASYLLFILLIASLRFSSNRIPDLPSGQRVIRISEALIYVYIIFTTRNNTILRFVVEMLFVFSLSFVCFLGSFNNVNALTAERRHWSPINISLVYDIFFGSACLLTIGRVLYFAQLHRTCGSTIISTGRCLFTVINYFLIMFVVMFAFAVAVNTIHQPYMRSHSLGSNEQLNSEKLIFSDLIGSMKMLFWAFYGYLHPTDYELSAKSRVSNEFVTRIGVECLVAIYYIVMVIALLNLMISLLVKRAHEVLDNEEVEWKYTRMQIYSEYFEPTSAVPPPFNLIFLLTLNIKRIISANWKWNDFNGLIPRQYLNPNEETVVQEHWKYKELLSLLFRRYLHSRHFHYTTTINFRHNNLPIAKTMFMQKATRAIEAAGSDAALQMQLIRRIHEDLFGGTFGVLIIKNAELVSSAVHWTIPDHRHDDGTPAFCLTIENGWQYNIFKTGNADSTSRMTVHEVINRIQQEKQKPERLSVNEFDKKIAAALVKRRQAKLSVADDA